MGETVVIRPLSEKDLARIPVVDSETQFDRHSTNMYKTMTNLLGFSRTGEAIEAKYDEALQMLKRHELVTEEDGMLSLR